MATTAAVYTKAADSRAAGEHLGAQVAEALHGEPPDALIVFASSKFDYPVLLAALSERCRPKVLVGSSSAGEFTGNQRGEGTACALALRAKDMAFNAALGKGVGSDRAAAARALCAGFRGLAPNEQRSRAALVMTDALAGHAADLVQELTVRTSGKYQFAGGGAGDDAQFARTHVFFGTEAFSDAVVALEILSDHPLGIGVGHGWLPASAGLRVTESQGMRLHSLNGVPAIEAFEQHAEATGQRLDRAAPLAFFLHNILGIDTGGGNRLRVPLSINADGSVECAAEVPQGSLVYIMKTTAESAVAAAATATQAAVRALGGGKPGAALFFDCVATRLRMGDVFGFELESVAKSLLGAEFVGCNTYGQIARAEGQFEGFHNCTAVVMVLPS